MRCPFCAQPDTKVIDSRLAGEGDSVRRRRECLSCGDRFTTFESAELVLPQIIKSDGSRQSFNEEKVLAGIKRALEKRPVGVEEVDALVGRLKHQMRSSGEREIASRQLGEWVMEELRRLDKVAYVRFASVYLSFQDIQQFQDAITRLREE